MKKLWISCALALALAALVVLGFVPTTGRAASSSEKPHESSAPAHEGKSEKGEGSAGGEQTFIHLQPLVLPIIGNDGAEQLVTLLIDLQVKDSAVSETVRLKMPRIQDSLVQALYGGFADGSLRNGDRVDIAKIKSKIASTLDETLGKHFIDDVLIQGVAQRML